MPAYNWVCHVCETVNPAGSDRCDQCHAPANLSMRQIAKSRIHGYFTDDSAPVTYRLPLLWLAVVASAFSLAFGAWLVAYFFTPSAGTVLLYLSLATFPAFYSWLAISWARSAKRTAYGMSLCFPAAHVIASVSVFAYAFDGYCLSCARGIASCPTSPSGLVCGEFPYQALLALFRSGSTYAKVAIALGSATVAIHILRKRGIRVPAQP